MELLVPPFPDAAGRSDLLDEVAEQLLTAYPDRRIFALFGAMGAGKTTFIQALCRVLGSADKVNSPTFALVNEYKRTQEDSIYHFDFYRIRRLEEVYDIGYEEYFFKGNYCFIEWPEMILELLPGDTVKTEIEVLSDGSRRFHFQT